jgi:hypothetical protein
MMVVDLVEWRGEVVFIKDVDADTMTAKISQMFGCLNIECL